MYLCVMAKKKKNKGPRTLLKSIPKGGYQVARRKKKLEQAGLLQSAEVKERPARSSQFKHGNKAWTYNEKLGRPKAFAKIETLLEAFEEYCIHIQETPWMKNELVKSGDMAGLVIQVPTIKPMTIRGFCKFVGLTYSWWKKRKNECGLSEKPSDIAYVSGMEEIEECIYNQKFEGAAVNAFNANIISRDLGLAEKSEVDVKDHREGVANLFPFKDDKEKIKNRGK